MRLLVLLSVVLWPLSAIAEDAPRQIVVTATGSAQAAPDMATVSLGVAQEARTASEAMQGVSAATQAVLSDIAASGIEARDVQTSSLNLYPVWDQSNARPRQVRGYSGSTMLTVRVRDLDGLGALLDSVIGEGANQLNGLSFGIADPDPVEDIARANAVAEAQARASVLAEAAGVTLGPVQTISEGSTSRGPAPMMRGAAMEAAAMPVAGGELDIQVTVTVVFAIAE